MKKMILIAVSLLMYVCASAEEAKIAFVNMTEVLAKYQKKGDEEARFRQLEAVFMKDLKIKQEKLDQLKDELKTNQNEDDRAQIQWDYVKLTKEIEFFTDMNKERFQHEYVKIQLEMIKEVKKTISDYGEEKKYFLILQTQPENVKYNNIQEAILQVNLADVVYHDKSKEITDDIIKRLNLRYNNKKAIEASKPSN